MNLYFPGILIYTERLPDDSRGCANGPIIRIHPHYKDDKGLHEHEAEHVRQWWKTLGLHSLLYLLSKQYRLWAEVAAYRVQLQYPPAMNVIEDAGVPDMTEHIFPNPQYVESYAAVIAKKYGLDVTVEEARRLLVNGKR